MPLVSTRLCARAALLAVLALGALAAPTQAAAPKPDLTIMSRNLYLGAEIITLASAPDLQTEAQKANSLYQTVLQTNFPLRAKALAGEVASTRPDVIGLQEVARYYRGPSGGGKARTLQYDWLALLQKEIRARGLNYRVVSQQTELDVQVASSAGYDLRLTLGNAVLVRTGRGARASFVRDVHGTFSDQLSVPIPGQTINLRRGYAGMQGTVAGRRFLFLDPHAEAYSAAIATKQFQQLLATRATSRTLPTIIAGDFNSDPREAGGGYNAVIGAGFKDTSSRRATCCQDEKLNNASSKLKTWIDHIVVRPTARVLRALVVGNRTSDRIRGLWRSDHAGVVATIRLR